MTAQQLFLILWFKLDATDQSLFQSQLANKNIVFRVVQICKNI